MKGEEAIFVLSLKLPKEKKKRVKHDVTEREDVNFFLQDSCI